MRGRIPPAFIDNLVARADIAEVVGSRIDLKRSGKNFSGLCPFHNEKTPSFSVNPDKQFYYCFGCGAGGNAIKFLMEYDNLEFVEAVETLARSQGVEVEREERSSNSSYNRQQQAAYKKEQEQRKTSLECTQAASDFFQACLLKPQGQAGHKYLSSQRSLSAEIIQKFALGMALDSWDSLKTELSQQGFSEAMQQEVGLITHNQQQTRTYDRFRNRVMFPIRNIKGEVVGFGGRVLDDSKPKYLNSPETPLFQKSQELYGLYEARQQPGRLEKLLVVEGYMDVVALAQSGIHWAVATLGTAASAEHLNRIFRMVNEVVFCFDGDAAGLQAAARALQTLLPFMHDGRHARFLFLPQGEDPDTLVQKEGAGLFEQRVNQATPMAEYLISHLRKGLDLSLLDDQARLAQAAQPLLAKLAEGLLKQRLVKHLEQLTSMKLQLKPTEAKPSFPKKTPAKQQLTLSLAARLIGLLVRYPQLSAQLPADAFATASESLNTQEALNTQEESFLRQLVVYLRSNPSASTQVLLAHWSGTAAGNYFLERLQQAVELTQEAASAEINELLTFMHKQASQRQAQTSYQALMAKQQTGQLSAAEQQQLWQLIQQEHQSK